jgi:hypothetical protein
MLLLYILGTTDIVDIVVKSLRTRDYKAIKVSFAIIEYFLALAL